MVTVADMASRLDLNVVTPSLNLETVVTGGYTSDLLSCVMASAQTGNVWVTLQAHPNVVAVASLLNLSCIVVAQGTVIEQNTIDRAEQEGVPVLSSRLECFSVIERLSELGIHGNDRPR